MGFWIKGLGFGIQGLEFTGNDYGSKINALELRFNVQEFKVWGF